MEPINVESINFYPQENGKENHTDEYDLINSKTSPTAIFRRGQDFKFTIDFNRPFNEKIDVVRVSFSLGPTPNASKGTKIILPILPAQKALPPSSRWGLLLTEIKGNEVNLKAHIPPTAAIGIWFCSVQTNISGNKEKRGDYTSKQELYVIFNPWCKDDQVYIENEKERNEYVLNETGKVWIGTFKEPKSKRWVFGQFDEVVLPATMFLLDKSNVAHADRGSAVLIARAVSALINSRDDDGLIEGKWETDYMDGVSPFEWSGSTAIMDAYLKSGGKSVKYGQCWVFGAVGITICRTLGIPCRCVTNYISAHDTNNSLTVDKYFDVFGNVIESGPQGDCTDSCWNFHVWTDVWMTRPDLPKGNDGWQVIDGTPQELSTSSRTYCCGPTSVKAVKNGEVGLLYDTDFVFSEVNADVCNFQEDEDSEWGFSRLSINRYHVGRKILTKAIDKYDDQGDSDMVDITSEYKSAEGSEAERAAIQSAICRVPRAQEHYNIPPKTKEDVFFDLIDIDTVPLGKNFEVVVHIRNTSNEKRTVTANMSASSIYYTGATANRLKSAQGTFNIQAGGKEILTLLVKSEDYLEKLSGHGLVKIYAIANVKETKQTWCEEDDFTFTKPVLTLDVKQNVRIGENSTFYLRFKNPLNITLTDCKYSLEGAGLLKPKSETYRDVKPNEEITITESFTAQLSGSRILVATFTSKQIEGIGGSATTIVE